MTIIRNVEVTASNDKVVVRWQVTDDQNDITVMNCSEEFQVSSDKTAFDAVFVSSIKAYESSTVIRQSYQDKVLSVDDGGKIVVNDKPAVAVEEGIVP